MTNSNRTIQCAYCSNPIPIGNTTCPSCSAPAPPVAHDPAENSQSLTSRSHNQQSYGASSPSSPQSGTTPSSNQNNPHYSGSQPFSPSGPSSPQKPFVHNQQFSQNHSPVPNQPFPGNQGFQPQFQVTAPPPNKGSCSSSIIGIVLTIFFIGLGIYTNTYGCGLPSGCVSETPVPIQLNETRNGELTTFHNHRLFELTISEPTQVTISVQSDWDNYLEIFQGESQQALHTNDDGGDGLNAMINTLLNPGVYYISVCSYNEGTGDFTLSVTGVPIGRKGPPVHIP